MVLAFDGDLLVCHQADSLGGDLMLQRFFVVVCLVEYHPAAELLKQVKDAPPKSKESVIADGEGIPFCLRQHKSSTHSFFAH